MEIIIGASVFIGLVGIFFFSYTVNKKTPSPEGIDKQEHFCEGCKNSGGCKFKI